VRLIPVKPYANRVVRLPLRALATQPRELACNQHRGARASDRALQCRGKRLGGPWQLTLRSRNLPRTGSICA